MSETTKVFLTQQLIGSESSRDPADRLARLAAKWRQDRGLDDSHANMQQSALAVMHAHPKLAKAYQERPTTLAMARAGQNPWADREED
jgi:hypothetical protein